MQISYNQIAGSQATQAKTFWSHVSQTWPAGTSLSTRAAVSAEKKELSGHMASLATPRSASSGTTVWAENYHNYNKNTFLDVSFLRSHIYHPPPICLWHKYCIVVSYFDGISSYVWLPLISANDSRVAGQRRPRQPSFLALVSDLSHQNIGNVWIVRDR